MSQNYKDLFNDWEIAIAKKLVWEFKENWKCLEKEDFEDLLQECLIHWLFARDTYDKTREASQKTYMGKVTRNKLTDLIRERDADKRKIDQFSSSLDEPTGNEDDSPTLIEKIAEKEAGDKPSSSLTQTQLKLDLSQALHKLTPKQQKICHLLGEEGLNVKQVSESLKTPRSTIYDEIKRIQKIFINHNLKDYLKM
jgi:RNA polymerase sigma factor (sigma-70 family)